LVIAGVIVWSSYHAAKTSKEKNRALNVGVITSVLGFSIAMLASIVIDNLFLNIVSKQADKIWGFNHSNFSSIQSYINWDLLQGVLVGVPASALFGLVCGFIGSRFAQSSRT